MKKAFLRLSYLLGWVLLCSTSSNAFSLSQSQMDLLPCTDDFTDLGVIKRCIGDPFSFNNVDYSVPGEYLIEIPDNDGCIDTTVFTLEVSPLIPPTINDLTWLCNATDTYYTVNFKIRGTPPFIVNGDTLPNNDSLYTSELIGNNDPPYFFEVEHSESCATSLFIQGDYSCNADCLIAAGTLDNNFRYNCDEQSITISHNGNATINGNELLEFFLYEGPNLINGRIIQRNFDGVFPFDSSSMNFGTPYLIAAGAGSQINGIVNIYDHCFNLSHPLTAIFYEAPELLLPTDTFLINCDMPEAKLLAEVVNGSGDFTMKWEGNGLQSDTDSLLCNIPGTFYFTLTDNYMRCVREDSVVVIEDKALPQVQISPAAILDCLTPQITLDAGQSSQGDFLEYQWKSLDGNIVKVAPPLNAVVDAAGIYILEIKDLRNGCIASDHVVVEDLEDGIQSTQMAIKQILCNGREDASIELLHIEGGYPDYEYTFDEIYYGQNGRFVNLSSGFYPLHIVDSKGCTFDTTLHITDPVPMDHGLQDNYFINQGDSIHILADPNFEVTQVEWFNQKGEILSDSLVLLAKPGRTSAYTVKMVDKNGCRINKLIIVRVGAPEGLVYIPHAFSPNGDQINDQLTLYPHSSVKMIRFFNIYSRWGDLVFACENVRPEESEYRCAWDGYLKGQIMKPAVFVYIASVELLDGSIKTITGDITLIR